MVPVPVTFSLSSPLPFAADEPDLELSKGMLMIESIKDPIQDGEEVVGGGAGVDPDADPDIGAVLADSVRF